MEQKTYLNTVKVEMTCNYCKKGKMLPTGITLTSYPPQYPHACDNCDTRENFLEVYPSVRYEEIS